MILTIGNTMMLDPFLSRINSHILLKFVNFQNLIILNEIRCKIFISKNVLITDFFFMKNGFIYEKTVSLKRKQTYSVVIERKVIKQY